MDCKELYQSSSTNLLEAVRQNTTITSKITSQRRCVHFSYFLLVINFAFLKHQETGKSKSSVVLSVEYYTENSVELIDKNGTNEFTVPDWYLNNIFISAVNKHRG
jgi:hypothetical protein